MPVPKANQRAVNKYVKNNYDRINVTMPKGKKETIQGYAERQGQSVNGYINAAIDTRIAQETAGGPQEAAQGTSEAGGILLHPDTLKAAQEAADAAGEGLPDFVARAVETQAQRDKISLAMGIDPHTGDKLEKEA